MTLADLHIHPACPGCLEVQEALALTEAEVARLREALNTLLDEFEGEPVYRHHRGKYEEWQVTPEAIDDARRAIGRLHPEEGS